MTYTPRRRTAPPGFDEKAAVVAARQTHERLVAAGIATTLIAVFDEAKSVVEPRDIEELRALPGEKRHAALGMRVEGQDAVTVAEYLLEQCHIQREEKRAAHASQIPAAAKSAVPPLFVDDLRAKSPASTPRRATTPRPGVTPPSAARDASPGSTPRQGRATTPRAIGSGVPLRRTPGVVSSTYERAASELRAQRNGSVSRNAEERQRLAARQQYHRDRSRSRSRSPTSSVASGRSNAHLPVWQRLSEPKAAAAAPPASQQHVDPFSEKRRLAAVFGGSTHRNSYLPLEVRRRAAAATASPAAALNSAFGRVPRNGALRSRQPTTPASRQQSFGRSATNPTPSTPRGGGAGRNGDAAASGSPAAQPQQPPATTTTTTTSGGASAPPKLRLSAARTEKLLAAFHRDLEARGLRSTQWANADAARRQQLFDEMKCPHAQRVVVNEAYGHDAA